jgi:hypothetical protein
LERKYYMPRKRRILAGLALALLGIFTLTL